MLADSRYYYSQEPEDCFALNLIAALKERKCISSNIGCLPAEIGHYWHNITLSTS